MLKFKSFLISFALVFAISSVVFAQEQNQKSEKSAQEATQEKSEHCVKKEGKDSCCANKKTASKKSLKAKTKKVAFNSSDNCPKQQASSDCCYIGSSCCGTACCDKKGA